MQQKKIEHISHDINVDIILKCLWAIKDNDQFYFNSYGKEMIENCINQKIKKEIEQSKYPKVMIVNNVNEKDWGLKRVVISEYNDGYITIDGCETIEESKLKKDFKCSHWKFSWEFKEKELTFDEKMELLTEIIKEKKWK